MYVMYNGGRYFRLYSVHGNDKLNNELNKNLSALFNDAVNR